MPRVACPDSANASQKKPSISVAIYSAHIVLNNRRERKSGNRIVFHRRERTGLCEQALDIGTNGCSSGNASGNGVALGTIARIAGDCSARAHGEYVACEVSPKRRWRDRRIELRKSLYY